MQPRTAIPTAILGVAGTKRTEARTNTAVQVTQVKAHRKAVPAAGDRRKRAAAHRPSAAATAEAGDPSRRVLVVRQAWAVGVAGGVVIVAVVVVDETEVQTTNEARVLVTCGGAAPYSRSFGE